MKITLPQKIKVSGHLVPDALRLCREWEISPLAARKDPLFRKVLKRKLRDRHYASLSGEQIARELQIWFKEETGQTLDLESPLTLNQKIQWLKLYDSTPLKTRLADKYAIREWIREQIGSRYLPQLYGVWDRFEDINFRELPDRFFMKATHGNSFNYPVPDKNRLDIRDAEQHFREWLNINFAWSYGFELQYRDIPPRIICEEYLEGGSKGLLDYKILCLNGRPSLILVTGDHQAPRVRNQLFDPDWNRIQDSLRNAIFNETIPRPEQLDELLSLSEKLCSGFACARADFYILENGDIRLGEMTFTSHSGTHRWEDPQNDRRLGEMLTLPKEKYYLPGLSRNRAGTY